MKKVLHQQGGEREGGRLTDSFMKAQDLCSPKRQRFEPQGVEHLLKHYISFSLKFKTDKKMEEST